METLALPEFNYVSLALSLVVVVAGMVAHWLKKFTRSDSTMTFKKYFFKADSKHTIAALMAAIGAAVTAVITGTADPETTQGVMGLFLLGYTADSAFNSDGKPKIR